MRYVATLCMSTGFREAFEQVHERSMDGDILLLELKELLKTNSQLKIILMSATINHELFTGYFDNAPLLTIPGFTHPVNDRYVSGFCFFLFNG